MNGAQALVEQLLVEDVDTIFALPGVQIMSIFDALYDAKKSIRLIQTRHEQAATYMAYGYAKATGKTGVAIVVPGPGALNASAGLGTAYASSAPVLLISGQIHSDALGKGQGQLHEIDDQLDIFKPITKWNYRVEAAEEIPEAIRESMCRLKTGRPRPVELEISFNLLETPHVIIKSLILSIMGIYLVQIDTKHDYEKINVYIITIPIFIDCFIRLSTCYSTKLFRYIL